MTKHFSFSTDLTRGLRRKQAIFFLWPQACNFVIKETLAQVFSCEFWEIAKNVFLQDISGRLLLHYVLP